MKNYVLPFLLLFLASTALAQTNPREFNFSGQLTDGSGNPMAPASVTFTLKIFSSTSCLLYQEDQNLNLASSNGKFSIGVGSVVGSAKRTAGIDPGNSMTTVFRNSGSIPGYGCTYNPSVGERRSLVVTVDDGFTVETLSAQTINSVPTAYLAENAEAVGGYTSADLLKVNIAASQVLSQSNLENIFTSANYSSLTSLLAGSSTLYNKPAANGTTVVPSIAAPSSPSAGQIWYNAGDILYYDGSATRTISTGGAGVVTFNGRTGAVTSATNDYTWAQIDKSTSSLADLTTRSATDLNTGTLNDARLSTNVPLINASNIFTGTNRFSGNLGVGITPTAALHLKAGAATAGTAPLKLTTGTNLTTPEAGAIEFDGTSLYYTDSTNTRRTVATAGGTFTGVTSISNSSGDITLSPTATTGSVVVDSGTASTTPTSGALKVSGGLGVTGTINVGGAVNSNIITATVSAVAPQIYGSNLASGTLKIDGTSHATPGNVHIASSGGNVGIGTSVPSATLDVVGTSVKVSKYSADNFAAPIMSIKARGTASSPVLVNAGDALLDLRAYGYDGSNPQIAARIVSEADFTPSAGIVPGRMSFYTTSIGGVSTDRMRIDSSGNIGIGTTAPTRRLHVNGPMRLNAQTAPSSPALGDIYMETTDSTLRYYNGSTWVTLSGGGAITLTGSVTGTGTGSITTSISTGAIGTAEIADGTVNGADLADDAVTYAKMQNIASLTLIGRSTAGSGDPESLTLGTGLTITGGALNLTDTTDDDSFATLLGVCANGFLPYKSASVWTCIEATNLLVNSSLIKRDAAGNFEAAQGTLNSLRFNNSGSYVTITNPIGSNYNLTLPIDDGTASQVLQTDGAGVLSWVTPAISGDFLRDGSLDMTGTLKSVAGSAASPGLTFSGDTNTGIFAPSADTVAITTGGSEQLRVGPSGNVGIGVTTPSYKLEVSGGDISTTGAYRIGADNVINWFSANQNLGVGKLSMSSLTSGSNNTGLGALTLQSVTSGSSNTAAGRFALGQLTTGSGNTAVGSTAMYSAGSAQFNTAVGFNSAYYVNGAYNTAVGWNALGSGAFSGATAYNTVIGAQSGYSINGGTQNTFVGYQSGRDNTTGNSNIAIGYQANDTNTTGSNNIVIGNSLNTSFPGASNEINVGNVFRLDSTNGAAITAPSNVNIGLSASGTGGVNISTVNGDISLNSGTGKVRIGQGAPPPFTAMGACSITAFTGITGANTGKTCSGAPVGAAINCSPLASPNAITWGAYVTAANTVTLNLSGGTGSSVAWACGWILP